MWTREVTSVSMAIDSYELKFPIQQPHKKEWQLSAYTVFNFGVGVDSSDYLPFGV